MRTTEPRARFAKVAKIRSRPRTRLALALGIALVATGCTDFDNPVFDELGEAPHCSSYTPWEGQWSGLEVDMVLAVSSLRGMGGSCGEGEAQVDYGANAPLVTQVPELRCAARQQAANMGRNKTLSHTGADGSTAAERIYDAGYPGIPRGELVARGELDPEAVLASWLADPEQCAAIYNRSLDEVGAGLFVRNGGDQPYWVLTLGTRR